MKRTSVSINDETKEKLSRFGKKGESFDTIIKRVMTNANNLCTKDSQNDDAVQEENNASSS